MPSCHVVLAVLQSLQFPVVLNDMPGLVNPRSVLRQALPHISEPFLCLLLTLSSPYDSVGLTYCRLLEKLAREDPPAFICHYYNFFFAHTAGGRMIGNKVRVHMGQQNGQAEMTEAGLGWTGLGSFAVSSTPRSPV